MSIRQRLAIIFIALVSIPLLLTSFITFVNYRDSLKESCLIQLQDVARFKADRIEGYFAQLKNSIEMVQGFYNIRLNIPILANSGDHSRSAQALNAVKMLDMQLVRTRNVLGLLNIMLTNNDGDILYETNPHPREIGVAGSLADLSPEALKEIKSGIYISEILQSKARSGIPEIVLAAPVSDLSDNPAGIVIFEIGMVPLYEVIQDTTGLHTTGEILLGKKSGDEIVYLNPLRHDPAAAHKRRVHIGDPIGIPIQKAVAGETGTGELIDYRGEKVVAAWLPVTSLGWGLVAKIDSREEFAGITHLRHLVMLILAVALGMTGILAYSTAQSISQPIRVLSKGVEIIGGGNLDHRVGTYHKDEIGQLSRSFDRMAQNLKTITASRDDLNREIAERLKVEEQLRESAEELTRSNKDLEQFAYVASHDLQEPLRAVAGFMGLLKKQYHATFDAEGREFIDLAIEGAERMQTLIHDLLTYSRVGTQGGAFRLILMKDAFEAALDNLQVSIAESDAFISSGDLPAVYADLSQMTQLFQNLIANAIKFHGPNRPEIHVAAERKDSEWVVRVSDNGIGIEPQYFERIFLIFQRLHARSHYKGTGIGLAVCKRIVERHGGSIWIESKPEKGSTFYFTIPDKGEDL